MEINHRIPFGYYLIEFQYPDDSLNKLVNKGEVVTPEDYETDMKGNIFCPSCTVPLSKVPSDENVTTSGITTHFRHRRGYDIVPCDLRTTTPKGKKFNSEESIKKAIDDGTLAIIEKWSENPPEVVDKKQGAQFTKAQIEDIEGEEIELPIGRHNGEGFKVPSIITSVNSLCNNFPENLVKYFFFPGSQHPNLLKDVLVNAEEANDDHLNREIFYYGEIVRFSRLSARNVIRLRNKNFDEFNIFTHPEHDERRHIDLRSKGRILLVHGTLTPYSDQPRIKIDAWGQYSLLPEKYESIIKELKRK